MRIYGLDVKDRKRSLNRSKIFTRAQSPPSARGYGADGRYRDDIEPLANQERTL